MHDIKLIRENPAAFDAALARRGLSPLADKLLEIDRVRREQLTAEQTNVAERNALAKQIGQAKGKKDDVLAEQLLARVQALKDEALGFVSMEGELDDLLAGIPNLPLADVPEGADEDDNQLVHERGVPRSFAFEPKLHDDIGPALGLDFETGAAMSGTRFTLVRGSAAKLHRALGQFMLDALTSSHGYEECAPPLLVKYDALYGTGQMPKFAEDLFKAGEDHWLIPTAEVSLTNIVAGKILSDKELPLRFTALTACFRSEAGAAGRDTRGLIRQHQFEKVEMVSIVTPDASEAEHERMTACAEGLLDALGLPFRRMKLCTGDMGFTAARTYDLEVWLPGQGRYREISSCSTCTDFQARRMNARYRPEGEKQTRFVHTLNGSALAVGRTLVAVLENYQQEDGSVAVPEVLQPYLKGLDRLEPV
jgi:seryl-tRNA synthetase